MVIRSKWVRRVSGAFLALMAAVVIFVRLNPVVFNESFFMHAHCNRILDGALLMYAREHGGRFPVHTNGYGDALLVLDPYGNPPLSGPCFSESLFDDARKTGGDIPEEKCGRVYVQGLSTTNDGRIAIAFDKVATPGDHTHFFKRFKAPWGRDVLYVGDYKDGAMESNEFGGFVLEKDWPAFCAKQIELLVKAGIPKAMAEAYYAPTLK